MLQLTKCALRFVTLISYTGNGSQVPTCDGPYNCALKLCKYKEGNISVVGLKPNLAQPCEETWLVTIARVICKEGWLLTTIWVVWLLATLLAMTGYLMLLKTTLQPKARWLIVAGKVTLIVANIAATIWVNRKRRDTGEELPNWYDASDQIRVGVWTFALLAETIIYCLEARTEHATRAQTALLWCTWNFKARQHLDIQRLLTAQTALVWCAWKLEARQRSKERIRVRLWDTLARCRDLMLRLSHCRGNNEQLLRDLVKTETFTIAALDSMKLPYKR